MTPSLLNAATDTVEADQQQHTLDKITAATAAACKSGACCDADLSHLGQLLVASHSSAALAAAASAAAALPTATATSAATGAAGNVGIGVSNFGMTSNRGGSHRVAESDHPVSPVVKQQVALEEELAAAKKTRARTLWKKVGRWCNSHYSTEQDWHECGIVCILACCKLAKYAAASQETASTQCCQRATKKLRLEHFSPCCSAAITCRCKEFAR
jgi:hypothetical protein